MTVRRLKTVKGLRMLVILAGVAAVHGVILLSLKLAPFTPPQNSTPVLAVQMMMLAPVAPPVKAPEPVAEPEPQPVAQTVQPPAAEKPVLALPAVKKTAERKPLKKVEKPPARPVKDAEPKASEPENTAPAVAAKPAVSHVVSQPVFSAAYLNNPPPDYPRLSRRLREEGKVMLKVQVSASGQAQSVAVSTSSGYPRLDQAAVDAVKRWRFIPAKSGNDPVAASVLVPLVFSLNS